MLLDTIIPDSPNQPYDMVQLIELVVDDAEFFQVHEHWARNLIVGFGRLDGQVVGIVANQPVTSGGHARHRGLGEGSALCALLRLVQHPSRHLRRRARLPPRRGPGAWRASFAMEPSSSTPTARRPCPGSRVITRKAYGGAYLVMNARGIRADMVFAWPSAEIAVMGAQGAVNVIFRRELAEASRRPGKADGADSRLRGAIQQSLSGSRARTGRRSDRTARDAWQADPRAGDAAHQARAPSAEKTRKHAALVTIARLLIANRGEIAVRVIRTAQEMGIHTIAIYSDLDRDSLHVQLADESWNVGPAPAAESYLNAQKILEVAAAARADAIHPGYGFLAENAGFAEAVTKAGHHLGRSARPRPSRPWATRSPRGDMPPRPGCRWCQGRPSRPTRSRRSRRSREEFGYPIAIKAAHGGGGKGMRVVNNASELVAAFEGARREADAYFGNPEVYVEKYLPRPRHVEAQILFDASRQRCLPRRARTAPSSDAIRN